MKARIRKNKGGLWEVITVNHVCKTRTEATIRLWELSIPRLRKYKVTGRTVCSSTSWDAKIDSIRIGLNKHAGKIKPRRFRENKSDGSWESRCRYLHSKLLTEWSWYDNDNQWMRFCDSKRSALGKRSRENHKRKTYGFATKAKLQMCFDWLGS